MGACVGKEPAPRDGGGEFSDSIERMYSSTVQYIEVRDGHSGGGRDMLMRSRSGKAQGGFFNVKAEVPWEDRKASTRSYIASKFQSDRKRHPSGAKMLEKSRLRVQRQRSSGRVAASLPGAASPGRDPASPTSPRGDQGFPPPSPTSMNAAVMRDMERRMLEEKVQNLARSLPSRSRQASAITGGGWQYSTEQLFEDDGTTPKAPIMLARLYEQAFENLDSTWASQQSAQALLAEHIHYVSPEKFEFHGKRSVCAKLNEAMGSIISRISQLGGAVSSNVEIEMSGPTVTDSGTWKMEYNVSVSIMKIAIEDEFTISAEGLISKLVRTRKTGGMNMSDMLGSLGGMMGGK